MPATPVDLVPVVRPCVGLLGSKVTPISNLDWTGPYRTGPGRADLIRGPSAQQSVCENEREREREREGRGRGVVIVARKPCECGVVVFHDYGGV